MLLYVVLSVYAMQEQCEYSLQNQEPRSTLLLPFDLDRIKPDTHSHTILAARL